jgi:hypothetical protein
MMNITRTYEELQQENDRLRVMLAKGKGDCMFCGLPAEDISKCASGFPGCARMDEMLNSIDSAKDDFIEQLRYCLRAIIKVTNSDEPLIAALFRIQRLAENALNWPRP